MPAAIAIAAHADDIEFQMAGTLLLLKEAGWDTHCLNLSTGNCGSVSMSAAKTRAVRRREAQEAARILGATKLRALATHKSQQGWLDVSQGMNSYLKTMEAMAAELGRMSRKFPLAEGWLRHSHLGFCAEDANPLRDALGKSFVVNKTTRAL